MGLSVVILAAGEGKRMHSGLPKCLHRLAGKPLLEHVVRAANFLKPENITVIYGHEGEKLKDSMPKLSVDWVEQSKQLGTGHAVMQALPTLDPNNRVLILYGDVPLITPETLEKLISKTNEESIGWLTAFPKDPSGLGRILRDEDGNPKAIIEEKDATEEQKKLDEINTGICLIPAKYLQQWLPTLKNKNSQKEYYLTDIFSIAVENGINITTVSALSNTEILGINDNQQLAKLERIWQKQTAERLMSQGLTLLDPMRFDIRGYLKFGSDVTIDINVVIEGEVRVGSNCTIEQNVLLRNVTIGNNVTIRANSVLEEAIVGDNCEVGPFARLRPGAELKTKAKVGNFVEIKKSTIGEGSKVNHLSYIGDTEMGKHVNVGAGTITCNYDGLNKFKTEIGDEVFIGSNACLIAPVKIGNKATIGASSAVTRDVPASKLTIARVKQETKENWIRPVDRQCDVD